MGSLSSEYQNDANRREYHVLVTGFGPFFDNQVNPSYLIASALPKSFVVTRVASDLDHAFTPPPPSKSDPATSETTTTIVHIHTLPHPIIVSYDYVDEHIPDLLFSRKSSNHDGNQSSPPPAPQSQMHPHAPPSAQAQTSKSAHHLHQNFDFTINLGLAPGRTYYALETRARRDGYKSRDIYGHTPASSTVNQHDSPQSNTLPASYEQPSHTSPIPENLPARPETPSVLIPSFDMPSLFRRWTTAIRYQPSSYSDLLSAISSASSGRTNNTAAADESANRITLDLSHDAGLFLCEYTFYACLSQFWLHAERKSGRGQDEVVDIGAKGKRNTRPCLFLHIPSGHGENDVRRGVRVALGLMEAVVGEMAAETRR